MSDCLEVAELLATAEKKTPRRERSEILVETMCLGLALGQFLYCQPGISASTMCSSVTAQWDRSLKPSMT